SDCTISGWVGRNAFLRHLVSDHATGCTDGPCWQHSAILSLTARKWEMKRPGRNNWPRCCRVTFTISGSALMAPTRLTCVSAKTRRRLAHRLSLWGLLPRTLIEL